VHASDWLRVAIAVTIMSLGGAGGSIAAEPAPSGGQPALDLIAGMSFDNTFKQPGASMPPTGPFSSWTLDQRRSFPADLQKLCATFWTFVHDAPGSRVLPASLSDTDEGNLGMDVCMVGHMPADWPERSAKLKSLAAILKQADQAGASLHLPAALTQ
jgi:hypothetical protein